MTIMTRFTLLILSFLLATSANATVPVVRYPSGTPVQVCQASDSNPACGAGSSTTPGGSDTQVQFNDAGAFGGNSGFTYDKIGGIGLKYQVNVGGGTPGLLSTAPVYTSTRSYVLVTGTFTVDTSTDVLTTSISHGRSVGDEMQFSTSGTLPAPLTVSTVYYVLSVPSATTMTLSTTRGGSLLDITTSGSGTQTFFRPSPHTYADESSMTGGTGLTTDAMNSFDAIPNIGTGVTGTYNHYAAFQARPKFKGSSVTNLYGFFSRPEASGSGATINQLFNFYASNVTLTSSGVTSLQYGLYIEDLTNASFNVGIASVGANTRSYHNGRWIFGAASYGTIDANTHFQVIPQANMRGLYISGYSLTAANTIPAAEIAGTWNTSGSPTLFKANVTNTASGSSSLLYDWQVGGTSMQSLDKSGNLITKGNGTFGTAGSVAGSLILAGSSSGTTTVTPTAAASGTLTLPAATDTLVGKATTDTLTNKTLTAPIINTGTIGTSLVPTSNDGAPLGDTTHQFSDLFLAEGGVINWDNGDATLTQVGDVVTLAGADLKVTTPGNASTSVVTTDGTQTLTNKRITKRVTTASDVTSITPNTDSADITYQANTQAVGTLTINADGGTPTNGQPWLLKIKSTNVQTFSWNAVYVGGTTALPTVTTGSSKIDYFAFIYDTVNSKWQFTGTAAGF